MKRYNLSCHIEVSFPSVGTDPELQHRAWGAASLIRASRFHLLASTWDTPNGALPSKYGGARLHGGRKISASAGLRASEVGGLMVADVEIWRTGSDLMHLKNPAERPGFFVLG